MFYFNETLQNSPTYLRGKEKEKGRRKETKNKFIY